ncbi:MAG TPA: BON domain-containing protein [Gemmatimonadaceae bacterium]|nr:BON domain-containing protein [Gemmatimonadaceae bacterium]
MANSGWRRAERAWDLDDLVPRRWDPRGSTPDVRPPYRASNGPDGYDPSGNWAAERRPVWGVGAARGLIGHGMEGAPSINRVGGFGPEGDYGAPAAGSSSSPQRSHAGRGPRNWRRPDARIEEDVNEALTRDPEVDASDVEVRVVDGEVTLTGSVADRRAKRRAEDVAERVNGVHDVHNRLTIGH